jgi:hypothetical protein
MSGVSPDFDIRSVRFEDTGHRILILAVVVIATAHALVLLTVSHDLSADPSFLRLYFRSPLRQSTRFPVHDAAASRVLIGTSEKPKCSGFAATSGSLSLTATPRRAAFFAAVPRYRHARPCVD